MRSRRIPVFLALVSALLVSTAVAAGHRGGGGGAVHVRGYYRSNGTYVRPHMRSAPDGVFSNNWSTKGNVNPYTGELGTKVAPSHSSSRTYSSDMPRMPSVGITEARPQRQPQIEGNQQIANFTERIKAEPSNHLLYSERGFEYYQQGQYAKAVQDLTQAISLEKTQHAYFHNRGSSYLAAGDVDHAIADFNEAIRLKPTFSEPYLGLSRAYGLKAAQLKAGEIADAK